MFLVFVLPLDYALYEDAYLLLYPQRSGLCLKNSGRSIKICSMTEPRIVTGKVFGASLTPILFSVRFSSMVQYISGRFLYLLLLSVFSHSTMPLARISQGNPYSLIPKELD